MVTFIILVKIYSIEYFCNTKVAGLGKIFVKQKFLAIQGTFRAHSFNVPHPFCIHFY